MDIADRRRRLLNACLTIGLVDGVSLFELAQKHGDNWPAIQEELAQYAYANRHDMRKRFEVQMHNRVPTQVWPVAEGCNGAVTQNTVFCLFNDAAWS